MNSFSYFTCYLATTHNKRMQRRPRPTAQLASNAVRGPADARRSAAVACLEIYISGRAELMSTDVLIDFKLLLTGYDRAFQRLRKARDSVRPSGDAVLLYIPLLETLTWADVIEERLERLLGKEWVNQLPDSVQAVGDVIAGFRYARNSVHHEWTLAVCLTDEPELLRDWFWRKTLPVGKPQKKNLAAYENHLAGRALRHTFRDLHKLYNAASAIVGVS
jgi:hypothetical protein